MCWCTEPHLLDHDKVIPGKILLDSTLFVDSPTDMGIEPLNYLPNIASPPI